MIPKNICTKWSSLCKIDFNFFDSNIQEKSTASFEELEKILLKEEGKKVVVNGGHFIPDTENYNSVGKNPQITWTLACHLVKSLKDNGIDARLTLLLNDLSITPKDREKLKMVPPAPFLEIMRQNDLKESDLMYNSLYPGDIYTEKKMSNRVTYLVRRTKYMSDYPKLDNHCVSAIIGYLRDIKEQKADIAVWFLPKCSYENYFDAINIFDQVEDRLRHLVYFETNNCYL